MGKDPVRGIQENCGKRDPVSVRGIQENWEKKSGKRDTVRLWGKEIL